MGIEIIEDIIVIGLASFLPLNKTIPTTKANTPTTISISAITDISPMISIIKSMSNIADEFILTSMSLALGEPTIALAQ